MDNLTANLLPDDDDNGLHDCTPVRRRISPFKMILFSALSALAVFVIWLFYPVKLPRYPLRAQLPDVCVAAFETHAPAAVNAALLEQKFGEKLRHLPIYPLIEKNFREQGVDLGEKSIEIGQQMTALNASLFGLRNCTAMACGLTLDAEPRIAILFTTDNLGMILLKAVSAFLPSFKHDGGVARVIHIPEKLAGGEKIPDFYLAAVPGTRNFLMTSDPNLFVQYRWQNPAEVHSLYPQGRQNAVELTIRLSEDMTIPALPLSAAFGGLSAVLPGGNAPSMAAAANLGLNGNFFFWWEYEKFGADIRLKMPENLNGDAGAGSEKSAAAPKLRRLELPAETRGLSLSAAAPQEMLAGENILEILKLAAGMTGMTLPDTQPWQSGLRLAQKNMTGNFTLAFSPAADEKDIMAAAYWEVDDFSAARRNCTAGARILANTIGSGAENSDSLLSSLLTSSLFTIKENSAGFTVGIPLMGDKLFAAFQPVPAIEAGQPSSAPGIICTDSPSLSGAYGCLATAAAAPRPIIVSCAPETQCIARCTWRYAPSFSSEFARKAASGCSAAETVLKMLLPSDYQTLFVSAGQQLAAFCDLLASLEYCTGEIRNDFDAVSSRNVIAITVDGALRLPVQ